MRRRAILAGIPAVALAACTTGPTGTDGPTDGTSPAQGSDPAPSDAGGTTAASTASPSPTLPPAVERALGTLDTRAQAGQLVLVGVTAGSSLPSAAFTDRGVGGLFLLGRWTSADAVRQVLDAAREAGAAAAAGIGPLLAVDQEGGQVRMLRGDAARDTASAASLAEQGTGAVREAYAGIGQDLAALGLGLDLAPVADVVDPALGDDNDPVGALDRGFGTDPAAVSPCVEAAVAGLAESGVASCLKHFPGLGRVTGNTDHTDTGIEDAVTGPGDPYLDPFRAGIAAGAGVVMVSSAVYPRIEADVPAMFSRAAVQDLLRGDLGFDGLVITDDIGAAAAVRSVPVGERATRFLDAGGDMVLTADPGLAGPLVDAIVAWADETPDGAARLRASATRALILKESLGLLG